MTTTAQAFEIFARTICLTEAQRTDASAKRTKTEEYLRAAFPTSSDMPLNRVILIGSADRGTMVRPPEDIDVMAQFTNRDNVFERYRGKSGEFLQRIRNALGSSTQLARIGARGQAVRLFYTNGPYVDIAPVFKWNGDGYALPSGDGGWITTDPEAQAAWLAERKRTVGSNLGDVIRLAKRWNSVHNGYFQSYHLEVLVANLFGSVGANHREALQLFFLHAPSYLGVSDPAGHSGKLDAYLAWNARMNLTSRLESANQRAQNALRAEAAGNHAEAKRLWAIELGPEFPVS
jgi:hypothetical protein